jgi:hypothetical protein
MSTPPSSLSEKDLKGFQRVIFLPNRLDNQGNYTFLVTLETFEVWQLDFSDSLLEINKKMELDRRVRPGPGIQPKLIKATTSFENSILKTWLPTPNIE